MVCIIVYLQDALSDSSLTGQGPEEIVKCGFWRKLPLLPLLWHANAVDEMNDFPIYSFTNDLLP